MSPKYCYYRILVLAFVNRDNSKHVNPYFSVAFMVAGHICLGIRVNICLKLTTKKIKHALSPTQFSSFYDSLLTHFTFTASLS